MQNTRNLKMIIMLYNALFTKNLNLIAPPYNELAMLSLERHSAERKNSDC